MSLDCPACSESHGDLDSLQLHMQSCHLVTPRLDLVTLPPDVVSSNPDIVHLKKAYARIRNKYLNVLHGTEDKQLTRGPKPDQDGELPCVECGEWFLPDSPTVVRCLKCHTTLGHQLFTDLAQPLRVDPEIIENDTYHTILSQNPVALNSFLPKDKLTIPDTGLMPTFSSHSSAANFSPFSLFAAFRPESKGNTIGETFLKLGAREQVVEMDEQIDAAASIKRNSPSTLVPSLINTIDRSQNTSPFHLPSQARNTASFLNELISDEEKVVRLKDSESQTLFTSSGQTQTEDGDDISIAHDKIEPTTIDVAINNQQIKFMSSGQTQTNITQDMVELKETTTHDAAFNKQKTLPSGQTLANNPHYKIEPSMIKVENNNHHILSNSFRQTGNNASVAQVKQRNKPTVTFKKTSLHRSHSLDSQTAIPLKERIHHWTEAAPSSSRMQVSSSEDEELPSIAELIPKFHTIKPTTLQNHGSKMASSEQFLNPTIHSANITGLKPFTAQPSLTAVKRPDFKSLISSFNKTLKLQDPSRLTTLAQSPKFHQDLTFISQNMEQIRSKLSGS